MWIIYPRKIILLECYESHFDGVTENIIKNEFLTFDDDDNYSTIHIGRYKLNEIFTSSHSLMCELVGVLLLEKLQKQNNIWYS